MPAVAITDHGNLFGAIEFYQEATARRESNRSSAARLTWRRDRIKDRPPSRRESAYHFTLLAENETGYRNLVKLVSAAHLDGFHYTPRIDKETAGGALGGFDRAERLPRGRNQQRDSVKQHRESATERRRISRYPRRGEFLPRNARSRHGGAAKMQRSMLPQIAREFGLGLVAANDVHFLRAKRSRSARRDALHRHRQNGAGRKPDALCAGTCISNRRTKCAQLFPRLSGGDHEHAADCRTLQSRPRVWEFEISGISGAGRQNARRLFARALLPGFARALRRTGDEPIRS